MKAFGSYKQEMQWLRLGEHHAQKNPFPTCLRQSMFSVAQLHALLARFWANMSPDALKEADIEENHDAVSLAVLTDRLLGLEFESFADLKHALVNFLGGYDHL